jgi:TatD family-associated radical SAM protein
MADDDNLVYLLDGKIYINLTNKCTNRCAFCIRTLKDDVCGVNLWLKSENINAEDVINELEKIKKDEKEIIFCGYGEPTLKLEILKEVAKFIKENYKDVKVRLNTNGHANFVYKRNVIPELKGLIDEISVSLNASTEELYKELTQPTLVCDNPLEQVKDFIKKSVEAKIPTIASVVSGYKNYDINLKECEKIVEELGAEFRVREWLDNGY